MKKLVRFSLVSSILLLMPIIAPHSGLQACWFGFENDKANFRFWLFQPDLAPSKALRLLNYPDLANEFQGYDYKGGHRAGFNAATDTSFYAQNIVEWQAAIKADPAIKSAKNVVATDFAHHFIQPRPRRLFQKNGG